MGAPSDDLNDLESDIGNLAKLLGVVVYILLNAPREGDVSSLDEAISLSIIARDMNERMVEAMAACHAKVIADHRPLKGRTRS